MRRVCLCIIFNHKYNKNIKVLDELYKNRFSKLYYIVPFNTEYIDGIDHECIITVYETSFCFQGYITQAYDKIKSENYSHYIFIGDDQILNPELNENNIINVLGLSDEDSYIKNIDPYDVSVGDRSNKLYEIIAAFRLNTGVNWKNEIPTYEDISERAKKFGYRIPTRLSLSNIFGNGHRHPKYLPLAIYTLIINKGINMPYPLYKSYADMIIINHNSMGEFCRIAGVLAAMNVFVETAIPLAMIAACQSIKLERDLNGWYGVEYWGTDIDIFEKKYNRKLHLLINHFENNVIYYHPVKLSRWK